MRNYFVIVLFLLTSTFKALSQNNTGQKIASKKELPSFDNMQQQITFNKILPPDGRTFEHVSGIVQDKQGYMWFATNKGLYRYDGYTIITYKNNPLDLNSLVSNNLESVCTDSSDMIWIGTFGAGLDRLDPSTGVFTHYHQDLKDPASLRNDTVTSVLQDHQGTIWVGTHGGLDRFDPKKKKFKH